MPDHNEESSGQHLLEGYNHTLHLRNITLLQAYHHNAPRLSLRNIPYLNIISAMAANQHTEHPIINSLIDIGSEMSVLTLMGLAIGEVPAGMGFFASFVVETGLDRFPSWDAINQMPKFTSFERYAYSRMIETRALAEIIAMPAKAVHVLEKYIKPIFFAKQKTHSLPYSHQAPKNIYTYDFPCNSYIERKLRPDHVESQQENKIQLIERTCTGMPLQRPTSEIKLLPLSVAIPLDDIKNIALSSGLEFNGQHGFNLGFTTSLQHPARDMKFQPSIAFNESARLGLDVSLRHPIRDLKINVVTQSGLSLITSLRRPLKDITVSAPIIPGVELFTSMKRPLKDLTIVAGLPLPQKMLGIRMPKISVSLPLNRLFHKSKKHQAQPTHGSTGLPFFVSEFNRGGGTERLAPNMVNATYISYLNRFNMLYSELTTIQSSHQYANILLPFILKMTDFARAMQQAKALSIVEQIAFAHALSTYLKSNEQTISQWMHYHNAMNEYRENVSSLQLKILDEAQFLSYVLHAYDFTHYPWQRSIYFQYYDLYYQLQAELVPYLSFLQNANEYVTYTTELRNLINYSDTAIGFQVSFLHIQYETLLAQLNQIYNKHQYQSVLLPFILQIIQLDTEIQHNQYASPEIQQRTHDRALQFLRTHSDVLRKWQVFYQDWREHYECVFALSVDASVLTKDLSERLQQPELSKNESTILSGYSEQKLARFLKKYCQDNSYFESKIAENQCLKSFYSVNYHRAYQLHHGFFNHLKLVQSGSLVAENQLKLSNVLNKTA